jgi:hypothetical protein
MPRYVPSASDNLKNVVSVLILPVGGIGSSTAMILAGKHAMPAPMAIQNHHMVFEKMLE